MRLKLPGIVQAVLLPLRPLSFHTVALSLAVLSLLLLRRANQVQPRLHIIMSGGKVSSRDARTALNYAATMAEVFRDAGELAQERELNFVCEELRENEPLLYRLSGYLKDGSLVALLDGRRNATVQEAQGQLAECCAKLGRSGNISRGYGIFDKPLARGVGLGDKQ